jgi:2-polyprenyl-6-hydroxyphenyl methylase/3-demethylubiquinone-9 3-methyltransferase
MRRVIGALSKLPSLRDAPRRSRLCKICGGDAPFFDVVDFNKYCGHAEVFVSDVAGIAVCYFRCEACDFIFTDFCDQWTSEDFEKYIYNDDYIIVDPEYDSIRPTYTADNMKSILSGCEALRIIDYGAGSGRFAAEMQQRGFLNVASYDPFSNPEMPAGRFDVVCLFEVIEHMPDPMSQLRVILTDVLAPAGLIVLTQTVQPEDIERIRGRWWYLGPRNGHVSTYSERTFQRICDEFNLSFFAFRPGYFAFYSTDAVFTGPVKTVIDSHISADT